MKRIIRRTLFVILTIAIVLTAAGIKFDIPVEELKGQYGQDQSKYVQIKKMNVHYREEGEGFPVVLIHGTAASLHTWNGWTQALKKKYRVIRMDLPAYGLTGPSPKRDYSVKAYVSFIKDFLDKLEIKQCHMAGNSLGGLIAWNFAVEHPGSVQKLILIDAAGYPVKKKALVFRLANLPVIKNMFKYVTPRFVIEKNLKEVYGDDSKVTDALVDRYFSMALREGNRGAFLDRAAAKRYYASLMKKIPTVKAKTLIMWGKADRWIPVKNAHRFDRDIPDSKVIVYKGAGHVPMEEIPEKTVKDAMMFFNTINKSVKKRKR